MKEQKETESNLRKKRVGIHLLVIYGMLLFFLLLDGTPPAGEEYFPEEYWIIYTFIFILSGVTYYLLEFVFHSKEGAILGYIIASLFVLLSAWGMLDFLNLYSSTVLVLFLLAFVPFYLVYAANILVEAAYGMTLVWGEKK